MLCAHHPMFFPCLDVFLCPWPLPCPFPDTMPCYPRNTGAAEGEVRGGVLPLWPGVGEEGEVCENPGYEDGEVEAWATHPLQVRVMMFLCLPFCKAWIAKSLMAPLAMHPFLFCPDGLKRGTAFSQSFLRSILHCWCTQCGPTSVLGFEKCSASDCLMNSSFLSKRSFYQMLWR